MIYCCVLVDEKAIASLLRIRENKGSSRYSITFRAYQCDMNLTSLHYLSIAAFLFSALFTEIFLIYDGRKDFRSRES